MTKKINAPAELPQYYQLMWPTIQVLKELGGSARMQELISKVAEKLKLSEDILSFRREGKAREELYYRMEWNKWYLRKAGIVIYQDKLWSLLPKGRDLTEEQCKEIPALVRKLTGSSESPDPITNNVLEIQNEEPPSTEPGSEESADLWKGELLARLQTMHFSAFERLTQLLLRKAGFTKVEVTGRTGDQGIDGKGVMRFDLISFHVLFQCKRYNDSHAVGSGELRDFRGAMAGRTEKGLFVTTGRFTQAAITEATREGTAQIELIDGEDLCDLLKKHQLGVTTETELIKVEKITINSEFLSQV